MTEVPKSLTGLREHEGPSVVGARPQEADTKRKSPETPSRDVWKRVCSPANPRAPNAGQSQGRRRVEPGTEIGGCLCFGGNTALGILTNTGTGEAEKKSAQRDQAFLPPSLGLEFNS